MSAGKIKLRTAGDVINRLRWSEEEDPALVLMGYDDRINGPMEKSIADYKTIDDGGDIPQHRIQYFRRVPQQGQGMNMNQLILWDREGRVDRLFGSGLGSLAPASQGTIKMVFDAIANMKRLAEYQEIRRQEKAKQRARRQRKIQAKISAENKALAAQCSPSNSAKPSIAASDCRFQWSNVDWFDFSRLDSQWRHGTGNQTQPIKRSGSNRLRFVTWNVLFDKFEAETALFEGDRAEDRWSLAIHLLGETDADLIALQEVTAGFIGLLCESSWVQEQYSVSAAPTDTSSIDPYGNIFLWKRTSLKPVSKSLGLSVLVDGARKRSVVACLQSVQEPSTVLVCACVHLPCDAKVDGDRIERLSRAAARRRELNTVVGKLQALEMQLQSASIKSLHPVLLGDFNSDEKNRELEDGGFVASGGSAGVFTDVWPLVSNGREGHTYHPQENLRAAFSVLGPRRIDRICVGKDAAQPVLPLQPLDGGLLGVELPTRDVPPSDHYGLSVLFELPANPDHPRCCKPLLGQSAWAGTVMPTTDTLLALTLGDSPLENTPMYDLDSTLPVPHITLLNGFAELMCQETRDLAMETVSIAVEQTLASAESCDVPFSRDSLAVFEHRSSATLVCTPDGPCQWLQTLYRTLRASFRFCNEQENRFLEGWSPHVSLGKFGSESDARQEANRLVSSGSWFRERCFLPAHAVVIYQRDPNDRKFYAVTSIPLEQKPKNVHACDPKEFLSDAGASLSSYFLRHSSPFVSNIERICNTTLHEMTSGNLEATLTKYGSCKFHASLPTISDIDAVVEVIPKQGSCNQTLRDLSPSAYLHSVGAALKSIHPSAKIRMRIAGTNGVALHFLTLKLNASAPSVDLMVCFRDSAGETVDNMGSAASSSIEDSQMILNQLSGEPSKVFEGALRLCKIWAYRRQIYGAPLGFLGGGGWALLIARAMTKGLRDGDLQFADSAADSLEIGKSAMEVLSYTFKQTACCWNDGIIALDGSAICEEVKEQALSRGTVSVIAPASRGDFARNATRSTAAVIGKEIQRANAILNKCADGKEGSIFLPIRQEEFLSRGSSVLFLEVAVGKLTRHKGGPCLPEIKAWAARQVLQLLVALESGIGNADLIRPFARPVRIRGKLLYIVRVDEAAGDLDSFVRKYTALVQDEADSFLNLAGDEENSVVQLDCFTAGRFRQAFA